MRPCCLSLISPVVVSVPVGTSCARSSTESEVESGSGSTAREIGVAGLGARAPVNLSGPDGGGGPDKTSIVSWITTGAFDDEFDDAFDDAIDDTIDDASNDASNDAFDDAFDDSFKGVLDGMFNGLSRSLYKRDSSILTSLAVTTLPPAGSQSR